MEQRWTVGVLPGAWAGSSGCPQAVAEARPAVRNLSGGACCPQLARGGAQRQDSVLSEARRSKCMRTGVTKPADIKQGRGFTVPAKGVTMEGKGSSFSCRTDAAASQGVGSWHRFSVKSDS